jgi:hypothetical protein
VRRTHAFTDATLFGIVAEKREAYGKNARWWGRGGAASRGGGGRGTQRGGGAAARRRQGAGRRGDVREARARAFLPPLPARLQLHARRQVRAAKRACLRTFVFLLSPFWGGTFWQRWKGGMAAWVPLDASGRAGYVFFFLSSFLSLSVRVCHATEGEGLENRARGGRSTFF